MGTKGVVVEAGAPTANKVEYDAHANVAEAVTLFQANKAEVKRRIKVYLKEGQNDVEVANLPTCLEESSIRVDGIGNATIFDVIYRELSNDVLFDL